MSSISHDKVALSTGPFHVSEQNVEDEDMTRLVITMANPTKEPLEAMVSLGICPNPSPPADDLDSIGDFAIGISDENEFHFGCIKVDCFTCVRIERLIDPAERRSTFRVLATGDFAVSDGIPTGGKLEITALAGDEESADEFGLEDPEPSTFIPFGDWIVVNNHCGGDSIVVNNHCGGDSIVVNNHCGSRRRKANGSHRNKKGK